MSIILMSLISNDRHNNKIISPVTSFPDSNTLGTVLGTYYIPYTTSGELFDLLHIFTAAQALMSVGEFRR